MTDNGNNLTTLMLSASDAAKYVGVGKTFFYSLHCSGRLGPLPIKLGRRTLWRRRDLVDWVAAGCPTRQQWLQEEGRSCHENL